MGRIIKLFRKQTSARYMNKENLEQKITDLQNQAKQHEVAAIQISGAIQILQQLLKEIEDAPQEVQE